MLELLHRDLTPEEEAVKAAIREAFRQPGGIGVARAAIRAIAAHHRRPFFGAAVSLLEPGRATAASARLNDILLSCPELLTPLARRTCSTGTRRSLYAGRS